MTCIVYTKRYPTKKSFREAALAGDNIWIEDPSFFNPRCFYSDDIPPGRTEVVTNHPKRSWFAQIGRKPSGELFVK